MVKLQKKDATYPLISFLVSTITLFYGLSMAKIDNIYIFYICLFCLYLIFRYWKVCLIMIPFSMIMILIFAGTTYSVTKDLEKTIYSINRSLAVSLSILPGLAISSTALIKSLEKIKMPKILTLGMMITIKFIPLFVKEMRQIRDAMKTRGVISPLHPRVFYRAFLLPLIVRIINISDVLAISLETRGFVLDKKRRTIYDPIKIKANDIIFLIIFILIAVIVPIALEVIKK